MGILSGIAKFFKRFFAFLKKLLKWLLPLLAIAAVIIAVWFPAAWGAISQWALAAWDWIATSAGSMFSSAWSAVKSLATAGWGKIEGWFASASLGDIAKVALGAAFLVDPKGTVKTVTEFAKDAGSAIGGVVTGVISGGVSSLLPLALGAAVVYFLFFHEDEDKAAENRAARDAEQELQRDIRRQRLMAQ